MLQIEDDVIRLKSDWWTSVASAEEWLILLLATGLQSHNIRTLAITSSGLEKLVIVIAI